MNDTTYIRNQEKDYSVQRIEEGVTVTDVSSKPLDESTADEAKHEYASKMGRNQEYYKDPTYHSVVTNLGDEALIQKERERYRHTNSRNPYLIVREPVNVKRHSKRYELVGFIMKLCELYNFELAERVVLRDKATGEILR